VSDSLFSRVTSWLAKHGDPPGVERRVIRGLPVVIANTRPDISTDHVSERLDAALGLIETYQGWRFRHLRRDVEEIVVQRFACRGAFFPQTRSVLTELTFLANPDFNEAQLAASIVHEGMHARMHACVRSDVQDRHAREERACRRAELSFGLAVPNGELVVERALATLEMADAEVAPVVDWDEARRRVEEVDRRAASDSG
jgi:hypothetical protein